MKWLIKWWLDFLEASEKSHWTYQMFHHPFSGTCNFCYSRLTDTGYFDKKKITVYCPKCGGKATLWKKEVGNEYD